MAQDENKDEAVLDEEQKPDQTPDESTEEAVNEEAEQSPDEGADKSDEAEAEEKAPEEDASTVSHRLEKRIERQLSKLMGSDPTPTGEPSASERPPEAYKPLNYAEQEEFDRQALEADRTKYGEYQRQQGESAAAQEARTHIEQTRFLDKLEADRERVEISHPELDPESDSFDPTLTDALTKMYIKTVGVDPRTKLVRNTGVRYRDYVETFLAVAERIASKSSETTARNITRQASRGAVKPQGQRPRTQSIDFSNLNNMDSETWEKNKQAYYASVNRRLGIQ